MSKAWCHEDKLIQINIILLKNTTSECFMFDTCSEQKHTSAPTHPQIWRDPVCTSDPRGMTWQYAHSEHHFLAPSSKPC